MLGYSHVGNISSAIQNVALRFCWVTDCNYVYQKEFDLNYRAFSTVCGSDTVMATSTRLFQCRVVADSERKKGESLLASGQENARKETDLQENIT